MFNRVVDQRLSDGSWDTPAEGDLLSDRPAEHDPTPNFGESDLLTAR